MLTPYHILGVDARQRVQVNEVGDGIRPRYGPTITVRTGVNLNENEGRCRRDGGVGVRSMEQAPTGGSGGRSQDRGSSRQ
jgi:hypothetical protein